MAAIDIATFTEVERFEALSQDGQISLLLGVREYDNGIRYRFYRYPDDRPLPPDRLTHLRTEIEMDGDSTYVFADTLVAARRPFYYTLGIVDGYGDETFFGPVNGTAYQEAPAGIALGHPVGATGIAQIYEVVKHDIKIFFYRQTKNSAEID